MHQASEDVLPYHEFSIRVPRADIPFLNLTLAAVTDAEYERLYAGLRKYYRRGLAVPAAAAAGAVAPWRFAFLEGLRRCGGSDQREGIAREGGGRAPNERPWGLPTPRGGRRYFAWDEEGRAGTGHAYDLVVLSLQRQLWKVLSKIDFPKGRRRRGA